MPENWEQFGIGWDTRDRARLHALWDEVLDSGRWSEGGMVDRFEQGWAGWNGCDAVATGSWTGGAMAALDWGGVRGQKGLCPPNTVIGPPPPPPRAGGGPPGGGCNPAGPPRS